MVHQKCVFIFQTFEDVSVGIFQRVATVKYGKRYFHSRQNVCAVRRMTATILVVENDRLIRDLVSKSLHRDGHQVLEACDGPPLLSLYRLPANGMTSLGLPLVYRKKKR